MSGETERLDRDRELVEFIVGYKRDNEFPPTVREIALRFGWGVAWTHAVLRRLRAEGVLAWSEGQPRTMVVKGVAR